MDEIDKICTAIKNVVGIDRYDLFYGKDRYDVLYRNMLSYILNEYYPHLSKKLAQASKCKINILYRRSKTFAEYLLVKDSGGKLKDTVKRVIRLVEYNPHDNETDIDKEPLGYNPSSKSFAKRLFGFEYTDADDYYRKKAIYESLRYMRENCN